LHQTCFRPWARGNEQDKGQVKKKKEKRKKKERELQYEPELLKILEIDSEQDWRGLLHSNLVKPHQDKLW
jgi:hypothetical protein